MWVESATSLGFHASPFAQDARVKDAKGKEGALTYVVKGKIGRGTRSLWELLGRAADGEDEAVRLWFEFESFMDRGSHWLSTWGMRPPRPHVARATSRHSTTDRLLMMLADLLGATSIRKQASLPTTTGRRLSSATISRIRRDDSDYRKWRTFRA